MIENQKYRERIKYFLFCTSIITIITGVWWILTPITNQSSFQLPQSYFDDMLFAKAITVLMIYSVVTIVSFFNIVINGVND